MRLALIAIMNKSVLPKGMHASITGHARVIPSRAITHLLQTQERTRGARTVHRPAGDLQVAQAISVFRLRESMTAVNLRITLTALALARVLLHTGTLVGSTVGCCKGNESRC